MRGPVSPSLLLLASASLAAGCLVPRGVSAQQVEWGAGIRPRAEVRSMDEGRTDAFTSMRTRLDLGRALSSDVRLFVQVQDVRLWGGATGVGDGSADQLDVHQAFVELGRPGESRLSARVGRQEAEWAEGRLVGIPMWSQVGNAYDGVRASLRLGEKGVLDLFGFQLREAESPLHDRDDTFYGAWAELPVGDHSVQLFALHDRQGVEDGTERTTFGGYYLGATGPLSYRLEGALQRGDLLGRDLSADMVAARVTLPLGDRVDATLWYDRYSGDARGLEEDGVPTGAFDDLFGRNHPFFGLADLFSDIPSDTRGRGIQDLALKLGFDLSAGRRLGLDVHRFQVADALGLDDGILADEVDVWVGLRALSGLDVLGGVSWVAAGDGGRELGVVPADQVRAYLQLDAFF